MKRAVNTSIPATIVPNGAKPDLSNRALSSKLTKICVVRVSGPAMAKLIVPCTFDCKTGSSRMAAFHFAVSVGSDAIPNWTTKPAAIKKTKAVRYDFLFKDSPSPFVISRLDCRVSSRTWYNPKERRAIEIVVEDQLVESIDSGWRPLAVDLQDDIFFRRCGLPPDIERIRSCSSCCSSIDPVRTRSTRALVKEKVIVLDNSDNNNTPCRKQ